MGNVHRIFTRAEAIESAADWLAKIDRGLSAAERAAIQDWIEADARHAEVLLEVAELWDRMDTLSRLSDLFPRPVDTRAHGWRVGRTLAASMVLAVVIAGFGYWMSTGGDVPGTLVAGIQPEVEHTFQTGTGEQSTINLPDGSQLTLNTHSAVRVDFSPQRRAIVLVRGEVHVQVAHDVLRPFEAHAADRMVRAVGTAFNLELTDDQQVELIVTEGKVLVNAGSAAAMPAPAPTNSEGGDTSGDGALMIHAGERIVLGQQGEAVEPLEPDELEVKLSWRKGNLVFRGESLETAIREIERYTTVEFVILDEELKLVRVAGLFKAGDVDGLLATLQENFNASYQRIGDEKVLLSGADSDKAGAE